MSSRFFESSDHTKLYQQYRAQPPQELIERILEYLRSKYTGELELALDVGCGSGQNTFSFAEHFKNVVGTDISPNQIAIAADVSSQMSLKNVRFEVSPAEEINLETSSVQLITAAEAAHWFNLPKFFQEGLRVLCPGGVMAIYGYVFADLIWERNPDKNDALAEYYKSVNIGEPLSNYWPPNNTNILFKRYSNIEIPYSDFTREDFKYNKVRYLKLSSFFGEIRTWSGFQRFCEVNGNEAGEDVINDFRKRLLDIIGEDLDLEEQKAPDDVVIKAVTPFFLLLARKSFEENQ
ncbi:unnamed protein product [Allacma fusca]|uniref:Methyltransferase type 11 domain-containing protein n=1 Tax=Allacma fusca TaxID=39272 RepID=A0A8J2JIV8_9HEXA|nr:unnamed protein product [Allacma fusca]